MESYRTAEIAGLIGVHPNTVRFYEAQDLLPPVPREGNGYRLYSESHLEQLRLIRLGLRAEILSNNLRQEAIGVLKASAAGRRGEALTLADDYLQHLGEEMNRAREAIRLVEVDLSGGDPPDLSALGRREAAGLLGISVDVLRDWERNGLIRVAKRRREQVYGPRDIARLKIISILRSAHYSQMSIRRMLSRLGDEGLDLTLALDTPDNEEDIVSVADRYLSSLAGAKEDALELRRRIGNMQNPD